MKIALSKQEKYFAIATLSYSFLCLLFALAFPRGTEVEYISSHYSNAVNLFFAYVTQLAETPGVIIFLAIVILKDRKQVVHYTFIAIVTFLVITMFKFLLFDTTDRPRVWALQQQLVLPVNTSDLLHHSFPSGHTAFSFCLMYCLVHLFENNKGAFLFFIVGIFVGLSRIYLLAHFVIDTGIGAAIGLLIGIVGNRIYDHYLSPFFNRNR